LFQRRFELQEINPIKEEMLESAKYVFAKYGYKKTTMNDIAKAVGIAKSSLYYYFSSKDEIFTCVVENELIKAKDLCLMNASKAEDCIGKLKAYVFATQGRISDLAEEFGNTIISEFFEFIPHIKNVVRKHMEDHVNTISQIIEKGVKQGIFFTDNPKMSAEAIIIAFIPFAERSPLQSLLDVDNNVTNDLFRILVNGLSSR